MVRRISRWERPPPAKDVRWFVRLVGKVLIVIGLLMFGFVAYQLWGTGIEYARAQDKAENEFEELMARASTTAAGPASSTVPASTAPATTEPVPTTITTSTAPTTTAQTTTTIPQTTTTIPQTTIPVFDIASMGITNGEPIARLEIPSIGHESIVVAGVERNDLKKGPGHYPQTPMPGQLGNSAIAGHRTTYGQPFFDIDQIEPGDALIVTTPYGRFEFVARDTVIVDPSEWQVIATTDPTVASLTLTSCHPKYSVSERIVIHADLDLDRSDAPGQPMWNYGRGGGTETQATMPGEPVEPAAAATAGAPRTTTDPVTTRALGTPASPATTGAPATTEAPTTVASTTVVPTTPAGFSPDDELYSVVPGVGGIGGPGDGEQQAAAAFGNTWFDDSAAWPHIALWGGAAAAIVFGCYQLAKAFRNSWIGVAAAFAPFLVALYFFYQNVNRLLPTAL